MATQQDVKNRIGSVKNIQKITRAMEMVAAARLRRAEQRIEHLRPYARAIRKMTRRVVDAVEKIPDLPLLETHESENKVGILLEGPSLDELQSLLDSPFAADVMKRDGVRPETIVTYVHQSQGGTR